MKKAWLLFDARYHTDPDRAVCFEVCDSEQEAKENAPDYGGDVVIVETEIPDVPERKARG